jgi:hypothetical protein
MLRLVIDWWWVTMPVWRWVLTALFGSADW